MKKIISLFLAAALCFSLTACGSNETTVQENSEETNYLTDTKWISLYSETAMALNKDGSFKVGDTAGTWTQDGDIITFKYKTSDNQEVEYYADILEENSVKFLKTQKVGKVNGGSENFSISTYYPEESIEAVRAEVTKSVGETVSTDILDVTVKKAALGYYANGVTFLITGEVTNLSEACEPSDSGDSNFGDFASSKGRCLLCIDFVVKNNDRNAINPADYISLSVRQNGKSAVVRGYDLNDKNGRSGLYLLNLPLSFDGGDFTINAIPAVDPGHSMEVKYVGVVGFDPDDLADPFEVIVSIKNSNGERERYIYAIND